MGISAEGLSFRPPLRYSVACNSMKACFMLVKIGTALAFIALSAPAFAQALGGFENVEGNNRRDRNIPQQYRIAPSLSAAPGTQTQTGTTSPPPVFSGSYNRTYNATYGTTYGNPSPTGR
jgi:hypothetical protein